MDEIKVNDYPYKLHHPFSMTVAGVSSSGKTEFTKRLLSQVSTVIYPQPEQIVVSYEKNQPAYADISQSSNVKFIKGLDFSTKFDKRTLLVIDDQMTNVAKS